MVLRRCVVSTLATLTLVTACAGPGPSPVAAPSRTPRATAIADRALPFPAYSATARRGTLDIRTAADGPVTQVLRKAPDRPLVLLVTDSRPTWVRVLLPVRPNGTTGWVRKADVALRGLPYRLDVRIGAHRLDLYDFGRLSRSYPIGVGTRETPTPGGTFFLNVLLQPPNPRGPYGPYAYGLSGFSNVLSSFAGGDGVIGIHGTDRPELVGKDVSHGCIRMANADITALVAKLPLGTPVRILA